MFRFCAEIQSLMREREFPVEVKPGPERVSREYGRGHVIIIERDREAGDSVFAPPNANSIGTTTIAKMLRISTQSAKATIYVRSSLPGAHEGNHVEECDKVRDGLFCALYRWGVVGKTGDVPITGARFIDQDKIPELERWPGVIYEVKFRYGRGIFDRNYSGDGRPTGKATGVSNVTHAYLTGGDPDAEPETGCGG